MIRPDKRQSGKQTFHTAADAEYKIKKDVPHLLIKIKMKPHRMRKRFGGKGVETEVIMEGNAKV